MATWDDVVPPDERALYDRGGWGGVAGYGSRPALLVIDMYTAFVDAAYPFSSPDAPAAVAVIKQLVAQARASGVPVMYSRGDRTKNDAERGRWKAGAMGHAMMARPEAYQIVPDLAPLPTESVVVKTAPSAFHGTNLLSLLVFHNVDTVLVTGTVTSGCVRATVVDAFSDGFRVVVAEDGVYDRSRTSHKVSLWDIYTRYGDVVPARDMLEYLRKVRGGVSQPDAPLQTASSRS